MGAWSISITGNDTAQDLLSEYSAAFYKYEVSEAVQRIDDYVRAYLFDESDEEEWCNYIYSLADYMWKKGILTDGVKNKALQMIDSDFGLELWAESGNRILEKRKKVLSELKSKILSPMSSAKKIRLNIHTERIFENGDIIAIQLQTSGKPYTENEKLKMTDEEFHSYDGKYIVLQLVDCYASWASIIAPDVKDYWAYFKLYNAIYDEVPQNIDLSELKPAEIREKNEISSCFSCESSMFYFKRRNYQLLGNCKCDVDTEKSNCSIFFGINKPWYNPDSLLIAAVKTSNDLWNEK